MNNKRKKFSPIEWLVVDNYSYFLLNPKFFTFFKNTIYDNFFFNFLLFSEIKTWKKIQKVFAGIFVIYDSMEFRCWYNSYFMDLFKIQDSFEDKLDWFYKLITSAYTERESIKIEKNVSSNVKKAIKALILHQY